MIQFGKGKHGVSGQNTAIQ